MTDNFLVYDLTGNLFAVNGLNEIFNLDSALFALGYNLCFALGESVVVNIFGLELHASVLCFVYELNSVDYDVCIGSELFVCVYADDIIFAYGNIGCFKSVTNCSRCKNGNCFAVCCDIYIVFLGSGFCFFRSGFRFGKLCFGSLSGFCIDISICGKVCLCFRRFGAAVESDCCYTYNCDDSCGGSQCYSSALFRRLLFGSIVKSDHIVHSKSPFIYLSLSSVTNRSQLLIIKNQFQAVTN